VHRHTYRRAATFAACGACSFFCFMGLVFLPHLGVQNDEALFAHALYEPRAGLAAARIFGFRFPLMLMSYLGTLKAWLWLPFFRLFGTGPLALRLPALAAGVASVWLFFLLLRRVAGDRAAVAGAVLLAADSLYLLTACFDWGPVALQHLLLAASMLLLVRFYQQGARRNLAGGFFLIGLLMWDKALAVWMLSGTAVALLAIIPRRIFRVITPQRVALAAVSFTLGATPLLVYNARNHWATFHGNFQLETRDLSGKARLLVNTAAGAGLFGWMVNEDWQAQQPHAPRTAGQKLSAALSDLAGRPRHNLMAYGFLLALALVPLARGDALRAILFALLALAVAWLQMAINANTGGSVHHTILLWPLPAMVMAVSFAAASRRLGRAGIPALAAAVSALAISGALVTNEYFRLAIRNGGSQNWTDAVYSLASYTRTVPARNLFCQDWGILDSLRLLDHGTLPLRLGTDQVAKPELTGDDRELLTRIVTGPGHVFLAHTPDFEFFPHNRKFLEFAAGLGYRPEVLARIPDSFGRPVYEVYRLAPPAEVSALR
jgi:4-amino-4-deoxy-L-arabinose transferase-like glycosyltransferase